MSLVSKAFSDIITFSRSSNATRVGPTGLVEYAPHNLLTYSEQFDNAAWAVVSTAGSVIANATVSPNGTVTADSFIPNTTNIATHRVAQSLSTASGIFTVSVYVKANGYSRFLIFLNGPNQSAVFNLATQTVTADTRFAAAPSNMAITSVGNGWYRCSFTTNISSDINYVQVNCLNSVAAPGDSWAGDGTSGIYIWGAQLSVGPYPLDYTPTTTAAVYGPRFDYDPVTLAARGLLVEEQRTNLITYSEQFNNAVWGTAGNVNITANAAVAPDGTVTADTMTEVATNATHRVEFITTGTSVVTQYTVSCYVKIVSGSPWFRYSFTDSTGNHQVNAWFDLTNGVNGSTSVVGSGVVLSRSITAVGNSWYRCTMTGTVTGGTGVIYLYVGLANADLAVSYLGSASRAVYLWGAQLEAGSFATSYIPTLASTVTRSADVASVNTLSPWFNNVEGAFFAEFSQLAANSVLAAVASPRVLSAHNGSTSTAMDLLTDTTGQTFFGIDGGSLQWSISRTGAVSAGQISKFVGAFKANDIAASLNGGAVGTDTSATIPTVTTLQLADRFGSDRSINGHLRRIAFYPRRLTNAELQALSA